MALVFQHGSMLVKSPCEASRWLRHIMVNSLSMNRSFGNLVALNASRVYSSSCIIRTLNNSASSSIKNCPSNSLTGGLRGNAVCIQNPSPHYYQTHLRHFSAIDNSSTSSIESAYEKEVKDVLIEYDERKKRRQSLVGTIVSVKNSKTISVQVSREKFFPKYNKVLSTRKKVMAHDENEVGGLGDLVRIVPCRPMSRMKRHQIIDVLKKKAT